jgi:hypothetical protein
MRLRSLPDILLALAAASTVALAAVGVAAAGDDRTSRRSAEMALPDSYLDPSWPDEAGEEMDGRYAPGKSDNVEEVPLGDEREIQEELRALQDPSGATLPAAGKTAPASGAVAPGAATAAGNGVVSAPTEAEPDGPQDDVEEAPDLDQRDPVEW